MFCGKCGGRVFLDRIFSEKKHVELFCVNCGKRWMLDKEKSKLAARLLEVDRAYAHATSISTI